MAKKKKKANRSYGLENYQHPDKFGKWLGYKVVKSRLKENMVEVELDIREDHLSPAGKVHGGAISAFFDFSCGAAVFTTLAKNDFCSTVELKVNYFRPLLLGDKIHSVTRVMFRGKKLCVVHSLAYRNREKKPVAMATATFNVVSI